MPKPKPPKGKRPPDLVNRLCAAIEELTSERAARSYGVQWVAVHDVAHRLGIDADAAEQAVAEALAAHRIIGDGSNPPHSVRLVSRVAGSVAARR
jgi:hypothetical protein